MINRRRFLIHAVFGLALLAGCASAPPAAAPAAIAALRYLGGTEVAREPQGLSRHFGGISGMDRDPFTGRWYLLSDDRSEHAAARFYTAQITIASSGPPALRLLGEAALLRAGGSPYPGPAQGGEIPDPEALRIDPRNGELVWSSEGDRRLGLQPTVRRAARDGRFLGELPLPTQLRVHAQQALGVRNNLAVEGLAFTPDGSALWVAMETALYEDGPVSTLDAGALARFTLLARDGRVLGQYAYPVGPIQHAPSGGRQRAGNGVSEILAMDDGALLVVERSGFEVAPDVFEFGVRLYEARADGATDVSVMATLAGDSYVPMRKRLLLDLSTLHLPHLDNIEAAAWGPRLPNGHATLVLASDDNFAPHQVNQLLVFEVVESSTPH